MSTKTEPDVGFTAGLLYWIALYFHTLTLHSSSSVLPQSACLVAGARRGLQVILGPKSGCTVRAWTDHCGGWSRSPCQTAAGGTDVERAQTDRLGAVAGIGAGCGLQPGQEPPGREWEKCVLVFYTSIIYKQCKGSSISLWWQRHCEEETTRT